MSVSNKNYSVFFENIDTKEALNIRYKKLAKVFHPDNENGDRETFEAIKEEYNRLIKDMR